MSKDAGHGIVGARLLDPRELKFYLGKRGIDAEAAAEVLHQAAASQTYCISGIVEAITKQRGGGFQVCIGSNAYGGVPPSLGGIVLRNYFYEDDLTADQLDELERAQNHRLCVEVCFDSGRVVQSIRVFACDYPT